jgi:hypothetical protein
MLRLIRSLSCRYILTFLGLCVCSSNLLAKPVSQIIFEEQNKIKCTDASLDEINKLQCVNANAPKGFRDLDQTAEYLVFQPIAEKQSVQLTCLLSQERLIRDDADFRETAFKTSCSRLGQLKSAIKEEAEANNQLQVYFGSKNDSPFFNSSDEEWEKSNPISPMIAPEKRPAIYAAIAELRKKRSYNRDLIQSIRETDPLLSSSGIFDAVNHRFAEGIIFASDTPEQACNFLRKNIIGLINSDIAKTKKSKKIIDDGLNDNSNTWLADESIKRALWSGADKGELLKKFSENPGLLKSTYCRMEGRYGKSAKTRDVIYGLGTFALGGIAGSIGKIAMLGVEAESTGIALTVSRVALGIDITSGSIANLNSVMNDCGDRIKVLANENSCLSPDGKTDPKLFYSRLDAQNCLYSASMALLGAAGARAGIKNALRTEQPSALPLMVVEKNTEPINPPGMGEIKSANDNLPNATDLQPERFAASKSVALGEMPNSIEQMAQKKSDSLVPGYKAARESSLTIGEGLLKAATPSEAEELTKIFENMRDLKESELTIADLKKVSDLNDKALAMMQTMLVRQGIKSEIRPLTQKVEGQYKPHIRVPTEQEVQAGRWLRESKQALNEAKEQLAGLEKGVPVLKANQAELRSSLIKLEQSNSSGNQIKITSTKFQLHVIRGKLKRVEEPGKRTFRVGAKLAKRKSRCQNSW